jgi:hypothetical protein
MDKVQKHNSFNSSNQPYRQNRELTHVDLVSQWNDAFTRANFSHFTAMLRRA